MKITLGYYCVHDRPLHRSPEVAERIASLLTDPRWPWQPAVVRPMHFPGRAVYEWPKGKVPRAKLHDTIKDIVLSERTLGITLVSSRQDEANHAWIDLRSGQHDYAGDFGRAFSFDVRALCRAHDLPAGKRIEGWLEVMHELTTLIAPPNAVIWAGENEAPILSLLYGAGSGRPDMVVDSPRYEIVRVNESRLELGARWIRPPAWGTYLKHEHLALVGGRERLMAVVQPPVVRDIGDLLYVQLSERIDDAVAPETQSRWRAFLELLEPITVPRPKLG